MICFSFRLTTLQWCHMGAIASHITGRSGVVFNSLFGLTSEKHQKSTFMALCEGNQPVTGGFPSQRASNADGVSIWLCNDGYAGHLQQKMSVVYQIQMTIKIRQFRHGNQHHLLDRKLTNWRRVKMAVCATDIFICIFSPRNCCILILSWLRYDPKSLIANKLASLQIMAWHRSGQKPSSEPLVVLLTGAHMYHSLSIA